MKLAALIGRLDRAQRTTRFKVIASIVVVSLVAIVYGVLVVQLNSPGGKSPVVPGEAAVSGGSAAAEALRGTVLDSLRQLSRDSNVEVMLGIAAGALAVLALGAIWIGLALTYLALFGGVLLLAVPLSLIPATSGLGKLGLGIAPLLFVFLTMLQLSRLAFSAPWPVFAVARNLLNEAVRMKISMVFIVVLLLMLAAVPEALHAEQPLRFRVQQWIQYGTGLGYAVLAMLTVFFSAATIAFEQRDRIIWQTMSKPVSSLQYLIGKWCGIMMLNAVLLVVVAAGTYVFTEYLRFQPAQGEAAYHISVDGVSTRGQPHLMSVDRRMLEQQVMVARVGERPTLPPLNEEAVQRAVEDRVALLKSNDSSIIVTDRTIATARKEFVKGLYERYRSVAPGEVREFTFEHLKGPAISDTSMLTLRFKLNAGSNDPAALYRVRFTIGGAPWPPANDGIRQVALKDAQVLEFPAWLVGDEGKLSVVIESDPSNPREFNLPPDGFEVLYPAGGFELNFSRVFFIMWIKLGFLAAVGMAAATSLSFPVACLLTIVVLFAAESASFLAESIDVFYTAPRGGKLEWNKQVIRFIALPISSIFKIYAELRPTEKLVDGRLLSWMSVMRGVAVVGGWTIGVLLAGVAALRNRELALYSGK
ncbi:MAG: hypothetical protein KDA20_02885 [Phycisphaerales bacterium]|nr:hypothetical protein [Phycisphaerales bacterium]